MDEQRVYCPGCNHQVRMVITDGHMEGHAVLPEGQQLVCLDFGEGCSEGNCPLTSRPGRVMGVRLAKSHLNDRVFEKVHGECSSCGFFTELERIDDKLAFCPLCNSTNSYLMVQLDDGDAVAVTGSV